jgi:hypothetical protein
MFSFDRWLVVAKDVLRWNDHCIHLFWDMVSLSTYYMSRESSFALNREDVSLDLEYVAIFLVLHLYDPSAAPSNGSNASTSKLGSPIVAYDAVWPSGPVVSPPSDSETLSLSPTQSPTKEGAARVRKFAGHMSGPSMSPRSPKANHSPGGKRGGASSSNPMSPTAASRTPRSSAQYLHTVRQKIPLILRSLCMDLQDESTMTDLTLSIDVNGSGDAGYAAAAPSNDFSISKKTLDALGLIICGGYSRDQSVSIDIFFFLCSVFPSL